MRFLGLSLSLVLAACSATSDNAGAPASPRVRPAERAAAAEKSAALAAHTPSPEQKNGGPFTGVWEECEEGGSPDDCGNYILIQRGDRICGTWSYIATADYYEGQVQALALSATTARRKKECGRPGSETQKECGKGWESIDKPLQLCAGKLAESTGSDGKCNPRYEPSAHPGRQLAALENEPWVQACLAGVPRHD